MKKPVLEIPRLVLDCKDDGDGWECVNDTGATFETLLTKSVKFLYQDGSVAKDTCCQACQP